MILVLVPGEVLGSQQLRQYASVLSLWLPSERVRWLNADPKTADQHLPRGSTGCRLQSHSIGVVATTVTT